MRKARYGQNKVWHCKLYGGFWFRYFGIEGWTEDGPFKTLEDAKEALDDELEDLYIETEGV